MKKYLSVAQLQEVSEAPVSGVKLHHIPTGHHYWVDRLVIREHDLEPCLMYLDMQQGLAWVRPVQEFFAPEARNKWLWGDLDGPHMRDLQDRVKKFLEYRDWLQNAVDSVEGR